jgi:two-component system, NtrC family, nitrogen regulation response regulator NtrX
MKNALVLTSREHHRPPVQRSQGGPAEFVGDSAVIGVTRELVRRAAKSDAWVLFVAEKGIAVESIARELHALDRPAGSFVSVDCAASDASALERLLFGADYSSTDHDLEFITDDCRIAAARGGTLFLKDVTELPSSVQARLARLARDHEVHLSGNPVSLNLRLASSAAPSIDADVREYRFRSDLFRRLAAVRIDLPSLRDRTEDVPALATRLVEDLCGERGLELRTLTEAALALLGALAWPGNIAELATALERVVADTTGDTIQVEHLLPVLHLNRARETFAPAGNLRDARLRFEREYILAVLKHHGWRMSAAAETLGIQRTNLYRKVRHLGIPLSRVSGEH